MRAPGQSNQLEAGLRIGDFEIEKRLGAGGMGIVYQARQVSLGRKVALKVLGQALTQDADLTRFRREAMAAARLKHPGIATLYFVGQDEDLCYHVMELVQGISLLRVIDRLTQDADVHTSPEAVVTTELTSEQRAPTVRFDESPQPDAPTPPDNRQTTDFTTSSSEQPSVPLSPAARQTRRGKPYLRRCCEIARDVARALAYAHAEGVVHRDIKPGNLMLDAKGHACIIDFGLARFFDDASVTSTGQLIGTPLYMSPEQVTGRIPVDHRSDVYSLGLVLYELLSLRRPFEATSRENLLRIIVTKALPPLSGRNPDLPRELEAIVHKATQKDPEERYQSAEEFANDLDRYLDGKAVAAPPYRYRLDVGEITARRPSAVVLAAFICFMAGCFGAVILTAMAAMMFFIGGVPSVFPVLQAALGLALFAGAAFLSHGLLSGWGWVRWVVAGLTAIAILLSLVACIALVGMAYSMQQAMASSPAPAKQGDEAAAQAFDQKRFISGIVAMYSVPLVMAFLCATTALVCLFTPATRAWFRLAQQTRREHWEMLRALGE
jgi:serine/threonine protein kinase